MSKPWRRGGILCPTTTEDNWIKTKTIFNLNTIPIAVIITPGPTVPSPMILVMMYERIPPLYQKDRQVKINKGITSNFDHYFHISCLPCTVLFSPRVMLAHLHLQTGSSLLQFAKTQLRLERNNLRH